MLRVRHSRYWCRVWGEVDVLGQCLARHCQEEWGDENHRGEM